MPLARIIGAGCTAINPAPPRTAICYMLEALSGALEDAQLSPRDLDGLVAVPSLVSSSQFMQARLSLRLPGALLAAQRRRHHLRAALHQAWRARVASRRSWQRCAA